MNLYKNSHEMGMYIHIPFCVKKCNYCDFLSGPSDEATRELYVNALINELKAGADEFNGRVVKSIFFGGGTPSVIDVLQTERIVDTIFKCYKIDTGAEITTEANPGTLDKDKLFAYRKMGFNRLSMGLQSANDHELKVLGRIHTFSEFLREYETAVDVGFSNINIDLMSAIPDQDISSWIETLKRVMSLGPQHISAYSLILEEGTALYEMYEKGMLDDRLATEDEDREMYYQTEDLLLQCGYKRYEISNYAKDGFECQHNIRYWERGNYAGFGIGAASLMDNVRYKNIDDIKKYISFMTVSDDLSKIHEEKVILSKQDCMEEFMFLGLRKTDGIKVQDFYDNFGQNIGQIYGDVINKLLQEKLLVQENGRIFLTKKGLDVSNVVMAEFLL